jgi:phage terminase small subunit
MAGVKGRSGRPRLSADEHRIRGTYRADRHGPRPPDDPPTDGGVTAAHGPAPSPRELKGAARRHWRYFAALLQSARVLTPSDIMTLADYCRACAAVEDRDRRLATIMRKRQIDWSIQGKLDRELRGWIERKMKLATELGLTPVSRTRVLWTGHPQLPTASPADQPPLSKLAQLQAQAATLRRPLGVK